MATDFGRRRFIGILAAAGALPLIGAGPARAVETVRWQGRALGADAEILLQHPDGHAAREALAACVAEVERLEQVFSLYRPESQLARLNAAGRIETPSVDLVHLLSQADGLWQLTEGAFDPSVQPVWAAREAGKDIGPALRLVGFDAVDLSPALVRFGRPGMALTLNGIAQGYVTDRVADLLKAHGFDHALVDLGELAATGPQADGRAWSVALRDPFATGRTITTRPLDRRAMASTAPLGTTVSGRGHLIDPRNGESPVPFGSVSVFAASATVADGLSTALGLMPRARWAAALRPLRASALVVERDGGINEII